jgi:predicted alpha/beta superfamily hydrolase
MIKRILIIFFLVNGMMTKAQEINEKFGSIQQFDHFVSQFVDARNISVWLPNNYSEKDKYTVLYMHDGQMLFGNEHTWNKQSWEVHKTATALITENKTQAFIIVAIDNNGLKRHQEFFPKKAFELLTEEQKDFVSNELLKKGKIDQPLHPISDNYLKFIVTELKPFIDKTFSTKTDREHTFIAGSSMGGLISLYAICEYPKVFGGAACLSSHWSGIYQLENNPVPETFFAYLKEHLPNPKKHKIYFDYGDQTLDALYPTLQQKVDVIMTEKGFTSTHWITNFFPGKDHSEQAWRERFHIPLEFLMGSK